IISNSSWLITSSFSKRGHFNLGQTGHYNFGMTVPARRKLRRLIPTRSLKPFPIFMIAKWSDQWTGVNRARRTIQGQYSDEISIQRDQGP
ncbi:MAG: hypothetical protein M0Z50_01490, partial [Planctomycetia bacterium]|nr:hypothetical protein [Planctomycetia bacterium]